MSFFKRNNSSWVVFLSTFPPRECGIATFTEDLSMAFDDLYSPREESRIVALDLDEYTRKKYSKKVISQFAQTDRAAYRAVAAKLNADPNVKLVSVQHEFGIFGGEYGEYILDFIDEMKKPVCVTFHTMLPQPLADMRGVVQAIAAKAAFVVVMTELSREIIIGTYGVPSEKVRVIHHGIHPLPYVGNTKLKVGPKAEIGLSERFVLSSFGLLGPGKGIEYAIEALPEIVKMYPDVVYLIIGATHPVVLKNEGEAYRNSLVKKINDLGLEKNVIFYNQYYKTEELLDFLKASDIYLSLSQNPDQAVSGTLSYALGVGRPVISTAFAHAREIVTSEVGKLIGFGKESTAELSTAIIDMMRDREKLTKMGETAYFRTRKMTWPNVALSYMREFISTTADFKEKESNLPAIKTKHISHLTDNFGMFQFAEYSTRNPEHGYTTDDNARALIAMVKLYEKNPKYQVANLIGTYLNFLEYVSESKEGFYNYVNYDKTFHTDRNSKEDLSDANARAYYSLAFTASKAYLPEKYREQAARLFKNKFNVDKKIFSPRAAAFSILALAQWPDAYYHSKLVGLADYMLELYEHSKGEDWHWFEDILAYSNGILPEALLVSYEKTGDNRYLKTAIESLNFLIENSFENTGRGQNSMCVPIGQSGWLRRGGVKGIYDQQPEEVATLVSVLSTAYRITHEQKYLDHMKIAFDWFLGNNRLGQMVYDESTGGSYDGVGETHINLNQGAESTVMYLLARLMMETA